MIRPESPRLKLNFTGKNTELLQSMYDYSIVPSDKIQKRMDFFYTPYNTKFLLRKHMTFDEERHSRSMEALEDGGKGDKKYRMT